MLAVGSGGGFTQRFSEFYFSPSGEVDYITFAKQGGDVVEEQHAALLFSEKRAQVDEILQFANDIKFYEIQSNSSNEDTVVRSTGVFLSGRGGHVVSWNLFNEGKLPPTLIELDNRLRGLLNLSFVKEYVSPVL